MTGIPPYRLYTRTHMEGDTPKGCHCLSPVTGHRERWTITVEPLKGRNMAIGVRLLLKRLIRGFGLRCVDIQATSRQCDRRTNTEDG